MNNVPKLRFKEFSEEWEAKLFGDIVTNKSKKYNPEKESISYKCIELEHLSTESGQLLGYVDSLNLGSIKNKFNKNDVLFGKLRPYLKKYLLAPFDGVCSSEIWVLNGINVTNYFLYYIVQSDYFIGLANQSSGSKMPRADWNIIENSIFFIPSKQEQEKIASFLASVDTKIEQLTKKEELLQQYKKGVIQKIFNQEIRFKADDGSEFCDWEEKKLGDIFSGIKGQGLSKGDIVENGVNKCILYGELYTSYPEIIKEVISKTNSINGVKSLKGDLLIPCSTTTTRIDLADVTVLYEDNVLLGGDITILRFKKNGNSTFFGYYLTHYKKYDLAKYGQGSTIVHMYYSHFKTMIIKIPPSIQEQNKIANFLSSVDSKIEQVNKQLHSIKEFKKALLQQMFV